MRFQASLLRASFLHVVFLLMAFLLMPQGVLASESVPEPTLAGIVKVPAFRQAVKDTVVRDLDQGMATELATLLLAHDDDFWSMLGGELDVALTDLAPRDRAALHERVQGDPEKAWEENRETITALFTGRLTDRTATSVYLRRFSCQVSMLTPSIEAAFDQARAAGKTPQVDEKLLGLLSSAIPAVGRTCDCLFEKAEEKLGESLFTSQDPSQAEKLNLTIQELMQTEQCPNPFAQYNG